MRFIILLACLLGYQRAFAQGIQFETGTSLEKILKKAQKENKNVFLDLYTTWCGPCKEMDRTVFTDPEVGRYFNEHFVSARFQMDSTKTDDAETKAIYADARMLEKQYAIKSYPSMLFLSPRGELLYKTVGLKKPKDLIEQAGIALDFRKNIIGKLAAFRRGKLSYTEGRKLTSELRGAGDLAMAEETGRYFVRNHAINFPVDSFLRAENLDFIIINNRFVKIDDEVVQRFIKNEKLIDSSYKVKGVASQFYNLVMTKVEIEPHIYENRTPKNVVPEWLKYHTAISKRFGRELADKNIASAKLKWFKAVKDLPNAAKAFVENAEISGVPWGTLYEVNFNNDAYEIVFAESDDPILLKKTAGFVKELVNRRPTESMYYDTYASLLYKVGDKAEAIKWEEKALELATKRKNTESIKFYTDILDKMKRGENIWEVPVTSQSSKSVLQPVESLSAWPRLMNPAISPDERFVSYYEKGKSVLLRIKSVDGTWTDSIAHAVKERFDGQSKVLTSLSRDSLIAVKLGSGERRSVNGVMRYEYHEQGGKGYLVLLKSDSTLVIANTWLEPQAIFKGVTEYKVSATGKTVAISSAARNELHEVALIPLKSLKKQLVWSGPKASNLLFDKQGSQFVFWTGRDTSAVIWQYRIGNASARKLLTNSAAALSGLHISPGYYYNFSNDGARLFITLSSSKPLMQKKSGINAEVWSYRDPMLQTAESKATAPPELYLAKVETANGKFARLQEKGEHVPFDYIKPKGGHILIEHVLGSSSESYWNPFGLMAYDIVSTGTGKRTLLKRDLKLPLESGLSADGKWIVYYNNDDHSFYSVNLLDGSERNITKGLSVNWEYYFKEQMNTPRYPIAGIWGWTSDGYVLLRSAYDIWKADPAGKIPPVNITNNIGESGKILLKPILPDFDGEVIPYNRPLLLHAYNTRHKTSGYYRLILKQKDQSSMELLTMGKYSFEESDSEYAPINSDYLAVSPGGNSYMVYRASAAEYPNFYYTKDFKDYKAMSNLAPHKTYNWLTPELHRFPLTDKDSVDGILYKPENFDPSKKYPVIIHFYDRKSHLIYRFPRPFFGGGIIDPAHMASNGYLVFTPDIKFTDIGSGESALRTVEAAGRYLAEKPWVDGSKMGINGGSFGGYEANYIAVKSRMFAAAVTASGMSNLVSHFNSIGGDSKQPDYIGVEHGQVKMRTTPWENPKAYVDASPVFWVNHASMPIMICHNNADLNVSFTQGVEFYLGLRRAGKSVWLLQYDKGRHSLYKLPEQLDQGQKIIQFFDHFLKDKPAPEWMGRE